MQKVSISTDEFGRAREAQSPRLSVPDDLVSERQQAYAGDADPGLQDDYHHPDTAQDEEASAPPKKAMRRPMSRLVRQRLIAASLILAIAGLAFLSDAGRVRSLMIKVPQIEDVIALMGFGLDQVTVKGQRFAYPGDIFDALDLEGTRSFISFDARAARQKIEAMPWIAKVEFRRVYPNELQVRVVERKPFAVWKNGAEVSLIDESGRALTRVEDISAPKDLPRFGGAGAAAAAHELWSELGQYPKLRNIFERADYVGKRRWDVRLANGIVLQLPDSGISQSFRQVSQWPGFQSLLVTGDAVVDLRARGRIAVRAQGVGIGATSSGPQSIADLLKPAG